MANIPKINDDNALALYQNNVHAMNDQTINDHMQDIKYRPGDLTEQEIAAHATLFREKIKRQRREREAGLERSR